jgi:hypothetical protein
VAAWFEAIQMSSSDQILRAHSAIVSLRANVPEGYEVEERWVKEFNSAVGKLESAQAIDLHEFKVPQDALERSVGSSNYVTGEVNYRKGLWCRREVLMQKVDAILIYLRGPQGPQE